MTIVFFALEATLADGTPVIALLPDDGLKVRFFVPQAELPARTTCRPAESSPRSRVSDGGGAGAASCVTDAGLS